jgi:hypothetical protein
MSELDQRQVELGETSRWDFSDREALRDEHRGSLQHLGYTIPPQTDSGWLGEAGMLSVIVQLQGPARRRNAG